MKKYSKLFASLLICLNVFGQSALTIHPYTALPQDSVISHGLVTGLNEFILNIDPSNSRIQHKNKIATLCLMDEFIDIENTQSRKNIFKPYLNNVVQLNDSTFHVQMSYVGIDSITPLQRAHFDIICHLNKNNTFTFSSPLAETMATKHWKSTEIGNMTIFYQNELDKSLLQKFYDEKIEIDKKFKKEESNEVIYLVSNSIEALRLLGVTYRLDYNGRKKMTLSYTLDNTKLTITSASFDDGYGAFDAHDHFHTLASDAITGDNYNHYMVCGAGYVYGGSWGISWDEIKEIFKTKMMNSAKKDWLKLYKERYNFGESRAKHLLVTQFINALIVEKTEKKKGFLAVLELLNSGDFRENSDYFFKELNRITGINKNNFNAEVKELLKNI